MAKPRILIHVCCAPDALYVASLLRNDYDVTGYFYNPNVQPAEEYALRLAEARKVAGILGIGLLEGPYDEESWIRMTRKFRDEPEKGRRCDICYAMRLRKTAEAARGGSFALFTTVMSLSPWKKAPTMNRIGKMFAARYGVAYLEADFKKKDGFPKSVAMSKDLGLYRQDYCGCFSSRKESQTAGPADETKPGTDEAQGPIRGKRRE